MGEFKNKFKKVWIDKVFITFTILYRVCLGLYLAVKNDYEYTTMMIMAVCLLFVLYLIVNLPYIDTFQNYRSAASHLSILAILFAGNYYRTMKSNTPMETKAYIFGPAIVELVTIGTVIVVSLIVTSY